MDDRPKTVAAITLIFVFIGVIILVTVVMMTRKKPVVSPIPEDGAIRIIFVSPTLTPVPSTTMTPTPTTKPKATATPKPPAKQDLAPQGTPTKAASPSATPKP